MTTSSPPDTRFTFEVRALHADGGYRWTEVSFRDLRDERREERGYRRKQRLNNGLGAVGFALVIIELLDLMGIMINLFITKLFIYSKNVQTGGNNVYQDHIQERFSVSGANASWSFDRRSPGFFPDCGHGAPG